MTFIADGEQQRMELLQSSKIDEIEANIYEWFHEYRAESLCINNVNITYPAIKSGYAIVEGKTAQRLLDDGKPTYFSLKNMSYIMKLGIRKGDILHLTGISSFTVTNVAYGDRVLCIDLE
jgi:hypothetical protein